MGESLLYHPRDVHIADRSEYRIDVRIGSTTRHLLYVVTTSAAGIGAVVAAFALLRRPLPSSVLLLGVPGVIAIFVIGLSTSTRIAAEQITKSVTFETRHLLLLKKSFEIPFSQITHVVILNDPKGRLVRGLAENPWGVGLRSRDGETYYLLFSEDEALIRQIGAGISLASGARVVETDTTGYFVLPEARASRFKKKNRLLEEALAAAEQDPELPVEGQPAEPAEPEATAEAPDEAG